MNTRTQGSSNEASIPTGLPGTVTLEWNSSTGPSYQFVSTTPPREITSIISRPNVASSLYSPVPSLLSAAISSSSSNSFLDSSRIAQMANQDQTLSSRSRSRSREDSLGWSPPVSPVMRRGRPRKSQKKKCKEKEDVENAICLELAKNARKENDGLVYLDGPRIYTCGECRTHLTSHDEIISKSFHGRHGRAYLFDMCVNITTGPAEDRPLITGLHSVSDIFCKRCNTLIGWTYAKAYELSQKYKEGKFIVEKIHLHMEESGNYQVNHPAGERRDRWKMRSLSWSEDTISINSLPTHQNDDGATVYEYRARSRTSSSLGSVTSVPVTTSAPTPQTPVLTLIPPPPDL